MPRRISKTRAADREKRRAEVVSLEALQKAALQRGDSRTAEWLNSSGLGKQPRLAAQLSVNGGWERAVETALGDYLEALCVDELDAVADVLPSLPVGRISLLQAGGHIEADGNTAMLSGVVSGPAAIVRLLSHVRLAETLSDALLARRELADDESVITRSGEWIGRDWLRVNRGGDPHSGVLEREQRVKHLKVELAHSEENTREMETLLATCRTNLATAERERDEAQSRIQGAHREHADLLGQLEGERARSQESTLRRERLEEEAARSYSRSRASGRTRWPAQGPNSTAAWKLSLSSIRAARVSKTNAKNAAKPCRVRAHVRRRRSSPVATC